MYQPTLDDAAMNSACPCAPSRWLAGTIRVVVVEVALVVAVAALAQGAVVEPQVDRLSVHPEQQLSRVALGDVP